MITPKTPQEILHMREGGKRLGSILADLLKMVTPGTTLKSIEKRAQELIKQSGGKPSFMTVGNYQWATCLCVNDEVVHGIPTERQLRDGDILTIDVGMIYEGLHTDTAYTKYVGDQISTDIQSFLSVGENSLNSAISCVHSGAYIGNISDVIQKRIEKAGYSIVRTLVGHGVGKILHEEPQIPGFLKTDIKNTPELKEGMTLAIEVIYAQRNGSIIYANDDGWTLSTRDGSLSAVFEHTVLVCTDTAEILTIRP